MPLSKYEKAAGRSFRDSRQLALDALSTARPVMAKCSPHSPPFFRHECGVVKGTIAMKLHDRVEESPEYLVLPDLRVIRSEALNEPEAVLLPKIGIEAVIPPGRFTFTYLEGECHSCGYTVRSGTGVFEASEQEKSNG